MRRCVQTFDWYCTLLAMAVEILLSPLHVYTVTPSWPLRGRASPLLTMERCSAAASILGPESRFSGCSVGFTSSQYTSTMNGQA